MASLATLLVPAVPGSSSSSDWAARRVAFFRIFNFTSIALMFYVALLFVLSAFLQTMYMQGWEQGAFFLAYIVRQWLVSAMLMLFALAAADALTTASTLPRAARLAIVALSIFAAVALSVYIRMKIGRVGGMADFGMRWRWYVGVVSLWTLLGSLAWIVLDGARRQMAAQAQLTQARCDRESLETQALEARLSALQAQIEPHFLFNTLANVKRLYETDSARGRRMLGNLLEYLRAALPSMRRSGSTLGRELELARSYLTILQLRMGERLRFTINAERAPAAARVPPMVLPTLVENAIKHGLSPLPEGGAIDIRAEIADGELLVQVADTGCGFVGESGSGVGLSNTRSRLAALYGERARLALRSNTPRGVVAEVRLPLAIEGSA